MNFDRFLNRMGSAVRKAETSERKIRKKRGPAPGEIQKLEDRLLRWGKYEIRILTLLAFRVIHWEIITKKSYEFETDNPSPFIVDCGANIGLATLYFKQAHPNARILAFEPAADACDCFEENIRRNRLENVTLHRSAVAHETGELKFFRNNSEFGNLLTSTTSWTESDHELTLPCVRLSDFLEEPVDYLKLDIEGSEMTVLEDLEATGKIDLIRKMGIEYHHHLDPNVDELGRFLSILERAGFGYFIQSPDFGGEIQKELESLMIQAYRKT